MAYNLQVFGTACAKRTPSSRSDVAPSEEYESYWLRTYAKAEACTAEQAKQRNYPELGGAVLTVIGWDDDAYGSAGVAQSELGIRPGFFFHFITGADSKCGR